jgi:hypothetical protein
MKRLFLCLVLGAAVACPSLTKADDSTNTPPPPPPPGEGPGGHHWGANLTDAERAELKKAHGAAITADPSLKTEEDSLHAKMKADHESGQPPSDEDKAAFKAFRDKMDAAMVKADPDVAPIIEKLKKAHHHHDGPGGGGPPPPPPSA